MRRAVRRPASVFALAVGIAGLSACATPSPETTSPEWPGGRIRFQSATLSLPQFLTGPAEIWGDLQFPRAGAGRLPAAVLVHSVAGAGSHERWWADELNGIGFATFVLDSFSGRGLHSMREQPGQFSPILAIVDAYRALELLSTHPRIDPARIALMGFSYGGIVSLYAALTRFQRLHGPPGVAFAAHVSFYPFCNYAFADDDQVTGRPIRIFHGTEDDWTPIAPCRAYVERLRRAGKDAQLIEYAGARHAFDVRRLPPVLHLSHVPNPSRCFFVERGGSLVDPGTGRRRTPDDPCWTRGVTMGFHGEAAQKATAAVKAFLSAALGPVRRCRGLAGGEP